MSDGPLKDEKDLTMDERLERLQAERDHLRRFDEDRARRPGQLTPRQRVAALVDDDSLIEIGAFAHSQYEEVGRGAPADGLIAGYARVDGRKIIVLAEDPLALAQSDAQVAKAKRNRAINLGVYRSLPIVYLADGSETEYRAFDPNDALLMGRVAQQEPARDISERRAPFVSVLFGVCSGQDAALAIRADLIIATGDARLSAAGAGAPTLNAAVDRSASDEVEAVALARQFFALLPGTPKEALTAQQAVEPPRPLGDDPDSSSQALLDGLVDAGSGLLLSGGSDPHRMGLGRIAGYPVAFTLTGEGAPLTAGDVRNLARIAAWSSRYRLPFLSAQDCAGYDPAEANQPGYLQAVASTVESLRTSAAPKISLITGRGHAMGDFALGGKGTGFDFLWAWPAADVGITDTRDYAALQSGDSVAGPWQAADWGVVDDVIRPSESREWIARGLGLLAPMRGYPRLHENRGMSLHDAT
ncbi:MAG: Acetyl-CoA carboxylase [Chloroflexi bacterium]|nr:MAG: Acetyl-CoA carboxylase [Chloroflexota bacterium]